MKNLSALFVIFLTGLMGIGASGCAHSTGSSKLEATAALYNVEETSSEASAVTETGVQSEAPVEGSEFDAFDEFGAFDDEMEKNVAEVSDPFFYWNKAMYHFNDKLYFWVLKPAARGYKWAMPEPARVGIDNFFTNLGFPIRFVGCLLQAKGGAALAECGRFGLNTTWGIIGFGNPARKHPSLNPSEEDMGQAFGKWGIGNGFYIVWPFLGPSTLRDSLAMVGEYFLDPLNYIHHTKYELGTKALDTVNHTSLHIGDYETIKASALDIYIAIRDAYIQNRKKMLEE